MAGYAQDHAGSVRGVAARFTRLSADGSPAVGTDCDAIITGGFINLTFTPAYSTGDEIEVKNAAGEVCIYFKMPDTMKNVAVKVELCDPDPALTEMLVGGDVLTAAYGSALAPPSTQSGQTAAVGYAAESIGIQGAPYGVGVEVWAQAVVNGKAAAQQPYWHYVFPYQQFALDGDRVVENGALATVFAGVGGGNAAFGTGPNLDTSGVVPLPSATAWDWEFPAYSDRPYAYSRSVDAPVGLNGCFVNAGIPLTAITAGIPATITPVNGTRPLNIEQLTNAGALGNTTAWTVGQYFVLRDGSEASWDGNSWEVGRRVASPPAATTATAGKPGFYGPTGAANPANLAAMSSITAIPSTNWTVGQFVNVADASRAYWSGSAWVAGVHP
jgi:hypothetical protein